jgi:uncharacterized sodium:solute symporter family permease YidK
MTQSHFILGTFVFVCALCLATLSVFNIIGINWQSFMSDPVVFWGVVLVAPLNIWLAIATALGPNWMTQSLKKIMRPAK